MGKFVVLGEIVEKPQQVWNLHVDAESILFFEPAPTGTMGKTRIHLVGRFLHVHDDVNAVSAQLADVTGSPPAQLAHVHGGHVYVMPGQVLTVTELRPRPDSGTMATVTFRDGTQLRVEDASALIAIL